MLRLVKFKKDYGGRTILKINDFNFENGIYWIRGINGSGKSTLLKAIAGIISFNGDIFLEPNISIKKNPVKYRKYVNFAEAEPLFPEFLTGREMIDIFSHSKNAPANQEQYYIKSMNMQPYINNPLGSYSSGMLKKLSLVLAFIGNPKLILLDEPLITLDVESLNVLYLWIINSYKNHGTSFLLSSHQDLNQKTLFSPKEILVETQTLNS